MPNYGIYPSAMVRSQKKSWKLIRHDHLTIGRVQERDRKRKGGGRGREGKRKGRGRAMERNSWCLGGWKKSVEKILWTWTEFYYLKFNGQYGLKVSWRRLLISCQNMVNSVHEMNDMEKICPREREREKRKIINGKDMCRWIRRNLPRWKEKIRNYFCPQS